MADPPADPGEHASAWARAQHAVEDRAEAVSESVSEFLLPSGTLKLASSSARTLHQARWLVFLVYVTLTAAFGYLIFWMFFSGRIEVWNALYKVDRIEAPSVAICPFNPGTHVRAVAAEPSVEAWLYSAQGPTKLDIAPRACTYDRECVCVDLFRAKDPVEPLRSPQFRDHVNADTQFLGSQTNLSMSAQDFQDRVEVRTNLQDSSPDRTLKFGFYDSVDKTPHWVYAHDGSYVLGQLMLDKWFVINLSVAAVLDVFKGDFTAMNRNRHIFRYFSQEIRREPGTEADRGARDPRVTRISYEMQTFFVEMIYASESALSLYSLLVLLLIFALRGPIVAAFFEAAFPPIAAKEEPPREMHWAAMKFMHFLCCGCCPCGRAAERQPLLPRSPPES